MKTVILCGGEGTRLRGYADMPKALVEVGNKPILVHLMELYASYGFNDFILCLGYKGDMIKRYFLERKWLESDFMIKSGEIRYHQERSDGWKIALVDTGPTATKAERLKQIQPLVVADPDECFFVAYGDDVSDVNLNSLLEFHQQHERVATVTAVHPLNPFGVMKLGGDGGEEVVGFEEKPEMSEWMNGGFYVYKKDVFQYVHDGDELEQQVIDALIRDKQLVAYKHYGFWKSVNTFKDVQELNRMWNRGDAPWKAGRGATPDSSSRGQA